MRLFRLVGALSIEYGALVIEYGALLVRKEYANKHVVQVEFLESQLYSYLVRIRYVISYSHLSRNQTFEKVYLCAISPNYVCVRSPPHVCGRSPLRVDAEIVSVCCC